MNFVIELQILLLHLVFGKALGRDPILNISRTTLPIGLKHSAAVYDGDDSIYILGGQTSNKGMTNSIFKFSISTESLESVAILPVESYGASAIWDRTGIVYFGGSSGFNSDMNSLDSIRRYIPGQSFTHPAGVLPNPNYHSTSIGVNNDFGEAYLFGGKYSNNGNKIVKYSKNLASVVQDARLPIETWGSSCIHHYNSYEDLIYLFGGRSNNDGLDSIVKYDTVTGQSSVLPQKLPYPLYHSSAVYFWRNNVYILGGISKNSTTNVLRFDLENKRIIPLNVDDFPDQLEGASSVFVSKLNRAYIFGGDSSNEGFRNQIISLSF